MLEVKAIISNLASSVPFKLLKPRLFQAKDKIKIKIFESGSLINLLLGFIRYTTMRRTFEVKPLMDAILRTEYIAHYNEPGLFLHSIITRFHYIVTGICRVNQFTAKTQIANHTF